MCGYFTRACVGLGVVTMAGVCAQVSVDSPGWFPFTVSPVADGSGGAADVSFLNAGGASSRISVRGAEFVDAVGAPVRFIGTNVTFSGAFPSREDATAAARRMAQIGFNVVRFHHMDARDIWLPQQKGLDPEKVDRLHWFIHQLKENGIYTNINLHVSRTYPGLNEYGMARTFRYGKVLDKFYEPYIRLQEQYAEELLDRVNPYTGLKLSQDPAVAFVELNNENTLLNLSVGGLSELTAEPLRAALREKWAAFLQTQYADMNELTRTWNTGIVPLGDDMVRNPRFENNLSDWTLEGRKAGVCEMSPAVDDQGDPALHITMTEKGAVSWAYQLHQLDVPLQGGMVYTLAFRARATPERRVSPALRLGEPPWTMLSPGASVTLTPDWQDVALVLPVAEDIPDARLRLSLNLGDAPGEVWVSSISLRPGQARFQPEGVASLADMPLPDTLWPPRARADFRAFLVETERDYVRRMRALLLNKLGVKSLIVDTQASYGGIWGTYREASLNDYIDMHSYWQHPRFPGKPWDGNNWLIPNTSMVAAASGGTFERLVQCRVASLPFSLSEYNHPAPNDHAAELFPMLAAFACHQDWNALYQFSYCNRDESYAAGPIRGYFELCHHPAQLVFAPIAALMFRQGLLPVSEHRLTATVPLPAMRQALVQGTPGFSTLAGDAPTIPQMLGARFGLAFTDDGAAVTTTGNAPEPERGLIWTRHLQWEPEAEQPFFKAVSPAACILVGNAGGRETDLGVCSVAIGLEPGTWVCLAMAAADGKPLAESARILLAVATRAENTNMGWNDQRTTVGKAWGSEPVVAQFVPIRLTLDGAPPKRVLALDPVGRAMGECPVETTAAGNWTFRADETRPTLWYALER